MNLARAFDTVNHEILPNKLQHYEIKGVSNYFMKLYLTNFKQFVSGNVFASSLLEINNRMTQGSIFGPMLFPIYINDLSNCSNFVTTLYANHSVLTVYHKDVKCLQKS